MSKFTGPLENLKIASPCSEDWNAMIGNDRQRFCGKCEMYVYNLSGMSKADAESMIATSEGRICARFYRRADGSVMTKDCPVGWQRVKNRTRTVVTAFASLFATFFGAIGIVSVFSRPSRTLEVGTIAVDTSRNTVKIEKREPALMGSIVYEPPPVERSKLRYSPQRGK